MCIRDSDNSALSSALEQLASAISAGNFSYRMEIESCPEDLKPGILAVNTMMEPVSYTHLTLPTIYPV